MGLPKLTQVSATVPEDGGYGGSSSGNFGLPPGGGPGGGTGGIGGGIGGTGSGRGGGGKSGHKGASHPVSSSRSGGSYNAQFILVNNITILTDAKSGHELYKMLLSRLERDLRRSGQISSMLSGGKAA